MNEGPSRTDVIKLDIYCISCRKRVVGLVMLCTFPNLHRPRVVSLFRAVYYMLLFHWIFAASDGHKYEGSLPLYQMIWIWDGV